MQHNRTSREYLTVLISFWEEEVGDGELLGRKIIILTATDGEGCHARNGNRARMFKSSSRRDRRVDTISDHAIPYSAGIPLLCEQVPWLMILRTDS